MGKRFNKTTKLLAGSLLVLSPAVAAAAGLGKLNVLSALGQPLQAEIDVVSLQRGERETLSARIASPDTFRQQGVEYGAAIPHIRARIEQRGDGRTVITLRSQQPVHEPFVDVLVELDSASGRLTRQYTFLLDPIGYKGPDPTVTAPTTVAQTTSPAPVAAPAPAPAAVTATPIPSSSPAGEPDQAAASAGATHAVRPGDTLAAIARAHKPQEVSLQQMLVALHRANEDAFIRNNMNLLHVGKILRIPDTAEVQSVAPDEAMRVVNTQARDFNAYRARLAQAVAAAPIVEDAGQQSASGRISTMVQDQPIADATPADELRLSRATDGAGSGTATSGGDDAAARELALQEANERIAELERNLRDMQQLLTLKNQQLAALQTQAGLSPDAVAETGSDELAASEDYAATASAEEVVEETSVAAALTEEAAVTEDTAETTATDAEAQSEAVVESDAVTEHAPTVVAEADPAADAATPVTQPRPQPVARPATPRPEPSFLDTVLDDPLLLAGGGGAIVALLGLLAWRRRRSAALDDSLIGMTTTDSSSVFGTTGGRNVDTGASSMQTDFSQSALGSIDTEEVDPVAEADVYMAYGRDAQAEEILKEALQKDPARKAVRLKLLEIYAARKDLQTFEETAREILAATGEQSPEWEKVVALGQTVDPANTLYNPEAEATADADEAEQDESATAEGAEDAAVDEERIAALLDLDLDLGTDAESKAPDAEPVEEQSTEQVTAEPNTEQAAAEASTTEAPTVDLDLKLDVDATSDSTPAATTPDEPLEFSPTGTLIMEVAKQGEGAAAEDNPLSLDLDLGGPTIEPQESAADNVALEFNLDPQSETAVEQDEAVQPVATADSKTVEEPEADKVESELPAVDLSAVTLDLDANTEQASDANWQEVATKLDLAKAYEEMGDKEGARELLNEVLEEGDDGQQEQARAMLETLG